MSAVSRGAGACTEARCLRCLMLPASSQIPMQKISPNAMPEQKTPSALNRGVIGSACDLWRVHRAARAVVGDEQAGESCGTASEKHSPEEPHMLAPSIPNGSATWRACEPARGERESCGAVSGVAASEPPQEAAQPAHRPWRRYRSELRREARILLGQCALKVGEYPPFTLGQSHPSSPLLRAMRSARG